MAQEKSLSRSTEIEQQMLTRRTDAVSDPKTPEKLKEAFMFSSLFNSRRKRRFNWKPAVDLSNPRIAAALNTFAAN
ncbi:hypothetical protein GR183_00155 [Stappia sp. GBMRC 2046]|uniref:Uncharacterized protein n=1 Tax=Stappia sediminis TaxID=2692190 RepID=A0A7X3S5K9_9HYPH|nr:hypothetical protein [Stappia sediminis]MXN63300.1 hypothetical protein [Stappia sediminis]